MANSEKEKHEIKWERERGEIISIEVVWSEGIFSGNWLKASISTNSGVILKHGPAVVVCVSSQPFFSPFVSLEFVNRIYFGLIITNRMPSSGRIKKSFKWNIVFVWNDGLYLSSGLYGVELHDLAQNQIEFFTLAHTKLAWHESWPIWSSHMDSLLFWAPSSSSSSTFLQCRSAKTWKEWETAVSNN